MSIASPDKTHLHHHLLTLLESHRLSVQVIYAICYLVAFGAIFLHGKSDGAHLLVVVMVIVALYGGLSAVRTAVSRGVTPKRIVASSRERVKEVARWLRVLIKVSIVTVVTLPLGIVFILPRESGGAALVIGWSLILLDRLGERVRTMAHILMNVTALSAIVAVDHYGRMLYLGGFPFVYVSHLLFAVLFVAVAVKTLLRNRYDEMLVDPFEYFLFFLLVGVTLLPPSLTARFHLVTSVSKSVLFLWGCRLVQVKRGGETITDRRVVWIVAGVAIIFGIVRVILP